MPSSPIAVKLTDDEFPKDWESLNKTIISDSNTAHYYGVWFNDETRYAWLMCCYIDENPSINDSWYHVEDMEEVHRPILDTIRDITGVSFHDSIWIPMTATEGRVEGTHAGWENSPVGEQDKNSI